MIYISICYLFHHTIAHCIIIIIECKVKETDTDKKVDDAHEMMKDLQTRMRKKLPPKNIYQYDIEWQADGKRNYLLSNK